MATTSAISSLLSRRQESLTKETIAFLGVNKQVEELLSNLRLIQLYMADHGGQRAAQDEAGIGGRMADISEICYEVEGALDDYALKVAAMRRRRSTGGFKYVVYHRFLYIFHQKVAADKVMEIANLNERIKKLMPKYDRVPHTHRAKGESSKEAAGRSLTPTNMSPSLFFQQGNIVGWEEDSVQITERLVSASGGPLLGIAICGLAGSGKNMLARHIYTSEKIAKWFEVRGSVKIKKAYEMRSLLLQTLSQVEGSPITSSLRNRDEISLFRMLYKRLSGQRYLILLHDVWSLDVWRVLRRAFPDNGDGSRILVTTRFRHVADQIARNGYVHEMGGLSQDQCLALLMKIASPNGDPDISIPIENLPLTKVADDNSEKGDVIFLDDEDKSKYQVDKDKFDIEGVPGPEPIASDIARNCRDLPMLAIAAVGRLLARKTVCEWGMVRDEIGSYRIESVPDQSSRLNLILDLCYKHLPDHLKLPFLYLGQFPEDWEIETEKLYLLWMAEGIMPLGQGGEMVLQMGSFLLVDLVDRGMVLGVADEVPTIRKFVSCELHRMLRDFCSEKAKSFKVLDLNYRSNIEDELSSGKIRRLAMYLDRYKDKDSTRYLKKLVSQVKAKENHLRSLLLFNAYHHDQRMLWPEELSSLKELRFLRVLDFDGFSFDERTLPEGIGELVLLKYLSLRGCYLKELPMYIGHLLNLQTLDLRVTVSCKMMIPNILWKLESLRHLYLPVAYQAIGVDKLRFAGLRELQILKNFDTGVCHAQHLLELTNIRILDATIAGNDEDLESYIVFTEKASLSRSTLVVRSFDCYSIKRKDILKKLFSCGSLYWLHVGGHIAQLPPVDSSNLTLLSLSGSQLVQNAIPTLGKLLKLRALVLHDGAYVGKDMVCSASSGFPELRQLELSGLHELHRLTIEKGAMPNLATLLIERCKNLQETHDLKHLPNLKEIKTAGMSTEFGDRLRQVKKEFEDVGRKIYVKILDDDAEEQRAPWSMWYTEATSWEST